jgi:hypothetical protein
VLARLYEREREFRSILYISRLLQKERKEQWLVLARETTRGVYAY